MTPYESVSWRKACEAVTFEIDYYVVAVQWQDDWPSLPKNRPLAEKRLRWTKQKTGKGPSNSRGTSQGPRRLSQKVHSSSVTKWTYTHLRIVAFLFPRCTTWQVYGENKDCLWCLRWISGKKFKQRSTPWTKTVWRQTYLISSSDFELPLPSCPCKRLELNVP